LEPALVDEQVEEIAVKEISAETEVNENGAIENGIETQLMEPAAPIEGKNTWLMFVKDMYRKSLDNKVSISMVPSLAWIFSKGNSTDSSGATYGKLDV
jgi:hypothetical protein